MAPDPKAFAIEQVSDAKTRYLQDFAVLPDDSLDKSPGGAARTPFQFTYEIICVNQRLAKRLRGEDPGPFSMDMWKVTPDEFRNRAAATQGFTNTMDEMLAGLEATPAEQIYQEIATPSGTTSPYDLALFCASHVNYHDGQLNYIQALNGDAEIHWSD